MRLFGQLRNKYAELPELEDPKSDASSAQTGCASSSGARDAVHVEKRFSPPSTISTGTNTLPLLLSPLLPPVTLKHALFCGLTTSLAHSSHMDESDSDGGERMFAYHSNTRNYIKRIDAPSAPAADSKHIDYKTEWECEQGIIWPKIVNYALQCSKGHNLTPLPWPISSVHPILCRLCGQDPSIGFPKTAASSLKSASACPYCDYVVCHACISAVAPHVQEPPQPPPPSLLHRGVRLDVVRQFKQNWGHVYGRWTTEQASCSQRPFIFSQFIRSASKSLSPLQHDLGAASATSLPPHPLTWLGLPPVSSVTRGVIRSPTLSTRSYFTLNLQLLPNKPMLFFGLTSSAIHSTRASRLGRLPML